MAASTLGRVISYLILFALIFNVARPGPIARAGRIYPCSEAGLDQALAAGGAATFSCSGPTTISITSTKTINQSIQIDGGGLVKLDGGGSLQVFIVQVGVQAGLSNLEIDRGYSSNNGGAILNSGSLALSGVTFQHNQSVQEGGAVYSDGGSLVVHLSRFISNSSQLAGGAIAGDNAQVYDSLFDSNYSQSGGAINITNPNFTIVNTTLMNNRATTTAAGPAGHGGAVYTNGFHNVQVTNSIFFNNRSEGNNGGAIAAFGGPLDILNTDIISNTAANGAAIAGSIYVTMTNTIVYNNIASANPDGACMNPVIQIGADLEWPNTSCGAGFINADAQLAPAPADHGGPWPTVALIPGSPAIDQGTESYCPAFDQRDASRLGPCDLGAYEYGGTLTTLTQSSSASVYSEPVTFMIHVTKGDSSPLSGNAALNGPSGSLGSIPLDSSGNATITLNNLPIGAIFLTASYSGNSSYAPSQSTSLSHTVTNLDARYRMYLPFIGK